jgi:hypothetical protein
MSFGNLEDNFKFTLTKNNHKICGKDCPECEISSQISMVTLVRKM